MENLLLTLQNLSLAAAAILVFGGLFFFFLSILINLSEKKGFTPRFLPRLTRLFDESLSQLFKKIVNGFTMFDLEVEASAHHPANFLGFHRQVTLRGVPLCDLYIHLPKKHLVKIIIVPGPEALIKE